MAGDLTMLPSTEPPQPLPHLRTELALFESAPTVTGEPVWLIHDPLQHRYIQIDQPTYAVLSVWSECRTVDELLTRTEKLGEIAVDHDSISDLMKFLSNNKLTEHSEPGGWQSIMAEREARQNAHSPISWLAHNYLFFRIPLWKPEAFLERTLPTARLLASSQARWLIAALGMFGLYLVSRQWDAFTSTFQYIFTWEGVLSTALALTFVKIMHEMGHAYTAAHYGCRVPTMGLAFMLMAPMLYTDVTDAWRLRERHKRLVIAGAGIMVELALAAVCIFAWAFLPDGPLRSVAFMLATVSVVASFAINLNPFMRFDGYYLLADWLGIENLQERSFGAARWWLREKLFGLGMVCPEQLSKRHVNILIVYAVCVWVYRLTLFIGIALIVYNYFFKALGIFLFLFEIGFFVARPVWSEMKVWWSLRKHIRRTRRSLVTGLAVVTTLIIAILPWSTRVEIPAVFEPKAIAKIFPSRSARIVASHITRGQRLAAGEPLFTLDAPDIDKELRLTRIKLKLARMQHARRVADKQDLESSLVLESTIRSLIAKIKGLDLEKAELIIRAPLSGRVAQIASNLHTNRWIGAQDMLAIIVDDDEWIARGYVSEQDLWRIKTGDAGTFIPEAVQRSSASVIVTAIAIGGAKHIKLQDLSSTFGGRVAVNVDDNSRHIPVTAQYPVSMSVETENHTPELIQRGVVVVSGKAESYLSHFWRKSAVILLRESGF